MACRGSRPVIGSSTIKICGSPTMARASMARANSPPDKVVAGWSRLSARSQAPARARWRAEKLPASRRWPAAAASGPAPPAAPPRSAIPDAGFAADRRAAPPARVRTARPGTCASSITWPLSGFSNPASTFSKVDLPAPLGPSTAMNSPAWAWNETSRRMVRAAAVDGDILGRQQGHGATLRMRTTSQKKKGVPSRLVKTPSRSSGLVCTSRAAISAQSSSSAPARVAGSSTRRGA